MTHAYCPAKHAGTPAHTCLCYHPPGHHGGHECRCGHYWGIDWDAMTYGQQWRFLGLPEVSPPLPTYMEVAAAISAACHMLGDAVGVQINDDEWDFSEMGREAIQAFLEANKEAS